MKTDTDLFLGVHLCTVKEVSCVKVTRERISYGSLVERTTEINCCI